MQFVSSETASSEGIDFIVSMPIIKREFNDTMPTYLYETIPAKKGEKPVQFELQQSMKDAPLREHPETGVPVRRLISGGFGYLEKGKASGGGHSCGSGCGCH